jgi:tetratricopeptide (TPR) repeat protein
MNIWGWVRDTTARLRAGEPAAHRLAQLIDDLPTAAVNEAHERVDAMVPEALALARELDEPWVQLFVRHWSLQSRVLHRRRAGDELREAVSLLDFASRTQACPQSVCAVQDLAICYAIRDGPGYVPQRLAVAEETLARIDPSWGCFDCISAEYFSALLDDEKPAEALVFIEAQIQRAAEHGEFEPGFNTTLNRARALALLGRAPEALELIDSIRDPAHYGRSRQMSHRQCRVSFLLALGRADEALALHPQLSAIIDTGGHLHDWVDNLAALIDAGKRRNTPQIGRELLTVQRRFADSSAYWDTARTALIGARLAAARGARVVTQMLLDDADAVLGQLRRPELLAARRAEVEAALGLLEGQRSPSSMSASASTSAASDNPERELDRLCDMLDAADMLETDMSTHLLDHAAALRGVGRADLARTLLETHPLTSTETDAGHRVLLELAQTLLAEHDHAALDLLLARSKHAAPDPDPDVTPVWLWVALRWILGDSLRQRGLLERAIAVDELSLQTTPDATSLRLRLAAMAREHGDWATALDALELAAASVPPGDIDWDRITAATVLGRWSSVRAAAARLDLEISGTGDEPIHDDLGVVRCEFVEPSGSRERYWARRTSPCAARIIEIAMPSDPQHFNDEVVFEPADLDNHLREGTGRHRPCFEVVAITRRGGFCAFVLRGHDPGAAGIEQLRACVLDEGYAFERITNEGRTAVDPRADPGGPELPTVAVLIAIPDHADPAELRELIQTTTASWELPLLGPLLDAAAGEADASERAAAMLRRWLP